MSDTPEPQGLLYKNGPSMMRLGVAVCLVLGALMIIGGLVGWLVMAKTDAPLIIGSGTGLITLALGAKAWQAQAGG